MINYKGMRNSKKSYAQRKLDLNKTSHIREIEVAKICNEIKMKKGITPQLGPRAKFMHYICDLKWDLNQAIDEIVKEFPALNKDIVMQWLKEENEKSKKGRTSSDDGR